MVDETSEEECSDESLDEDGGDSVRKKLIKLAKSGSLDQARALCDALDILLDLRSANLSKADLSKTEASTYHYQSLFGRSSAAL